MLFVAAQARLYPNKAMRGSLVAVFLGSVWVCLVSASSINYSKCNKRQLTNMFLKAQSKPFNTPNAEDAELKGRKRHLLYLYRKPESDKRFTIPKNMSRITKLSAEKHWTEKPQWNAHSSSMLPVDTSDVPGQTQLQPYPSVRGQQNSKFTFRSHTVMETTGDPHSVVLEKGQHTIPKRIKRDMRDSPSAGKAHGWSNHLTNRGMNVSAELEASVWGAVPRPLSLNASVDYLNIYHTKRPGLQTLSDINVDVTPGFSSANSSRRRQFKNPFYPLTEDSYGAYAIICLAVVIFFVGILGNISIMCIVCHSYYMRSISNSLLANLAFWDFLIIFFCLPLVIFHEITKKWLLGDFSCKIIPYIEVASLGVTTFTLCALCIDRFRAATNVQMYYEMIENCTSTAAKLAVIWIGALLLALPEIVLRQLIQEDPIPGMGFLTEQCVVKISPELPDTIYVLALTYDGARLWWYFGCYFCLPTLFTIGCSLVTAKKIRQAEKACARGNKRQIHLESQMNCTVVALTILYGFCIIPENICNIVAVYMATGVSKQTMSLLRLISQFLLFFKSCVTPILLFCLCKPFSQAFMECCCCCCEECTQRSSSATSDENDNEFTTELELSPFSTIHREMSAFSSAGTHC